MPHFWERRLLPAGGSIRADIKMTGPFTQSSVVAGRGEVLSQPWRVISILKRTRRKYNDMSYETRTLEPALLLS
jgi:hypothetical protein